MVRVTVTKIGLEQRRESREKSKSKIKNAVRAGHAAEVVESEEEVLDEDAAAVVSTGMELN
ncbi:hypothetical protein OESDEN_11070 [Oesophagostomum dentatum]|uniref:Uncharacterized protein n=1 Tax=Oesophagostomum dentatum TaxID=61180 RepID=A0A0B1SYY9_OESDE|nr:hypothetical protein OESDEN_11070 [Oesophagostomum dentatum]